MIQITKKERAAIQKILPETGFATSKWHVYMIEDPLAMHELNRLRQGKQAESGITSSKKRRQRRQRKAAGFDA